MRTGDIRSIPLPAWFFGLLALAYGAILATEASTTYDLTQTPSLVAQTLGPLIFATIVAYVVPADRRVFWGAALIAAQSILGLTQGLIERLPGLPAELYSFGLVQWGWIFELSGLVLLGLGLGGIRSRVGWVALALGLAVFAIGDIQLALAWIATPPDPDLGIPAYQVALSFVAGVTTVGWAFLTGVALDNRLRAFAIAAGIFFALDAIALATQWLLTNLFPNPDPSLLPWFFLPFRIGTVLGWLVLFAAAIYEVPRRTPRT
jgi:hypothetical protein